MERLAQSAALSGQADESDLLLYAENTAAGDPDMFMELAQSRILSENVSGSLKGNFSLLCQVIMELKKRLKRLKLYI